MFWLSQRWFSVLFTYWLCLSFFLLPVLFKSCLAATALFTTCIVNCISSCCGGVGLVSLFFTACSSLVLTRQFWIGVSTWNSPSLLSIYFTLVLLANFSLTACFGFFCYSLFKLNPTGSSKIALHRRRMFVCSSLLIFPFWLFSGCTSYTTLFFPLQSTIL